MGVSRARIVKCTLAMITRAENGSMLYKSKCYYCMKKVACDTKIVTKKSTGSTKWYHLRCAKKVHLIC